MSLIEKLYNGNLLPIEEVIPPNAAYRPLTDEIGKEREYFAGLLSAEDREKFDKWNKKVFQYEEMVEFANFEYGFRLGAMLIFELCMGGQKE